MSCHFAHNVQGYSLEIVPLDQGQHIWTHGLKDHADMLAMHPEMLEVVNQRHNAREWKMGKEPLQWPSLCFLPLSVVASLRGLGQKLDLIVSRLGVVGSALLDFHGHEALIGQVLAEPDRRKVAPAKLGDDMVPTIVDLANRDRVITTLAVTISTLVVTLSVVLRICSLWLLHPAPWVRSSSQSLEVWKSAASQKRRKRLSSSSSAV
mmetsp:Transcript_7375/g.11707  ORF Transcript_7375/g.11707 Transcript_7375/m.11707 type:complete len:207 (-) Transcript_7375:71-691(-)